MGRRQLWTIFIPGCTALASGCGGAPKPRDVSTSTTPCLQWQVSVDNEMTFPVLVYVYAPNGRTLIGGAPAGGITVLNSLDSGQVHYTPPLGVSMMVRGKEIRSRFRCTARAAPE
jgi:hypothetical protein